MKTLISTTLIIALSNLFMEAECIWAWGRCPKVQLVGNFNVDSYAGKWYEHARDKGVYYQDGDCV